MSEVSSVSSVKPGRTVHVVETKVRGGWWVAMDCRVDRTVAWLRADELRKRYPAEKFRTIPYGRVGR